jgi:hypothetical protein
MRHLPWSLSVIATLLLPGALPAHAQAPSSPAAPAQTAPQTPPSASAAAPGPYKPLQITLPKPFDDPSFEAFRKQLAEIATRKDRAALAMLVASSFFWVPEDTDVADKSKPAIESLSRALDLKEPSGWEALANFAAETSAMPDPQHGGAMCAPAEPGFDDKAADELANATQTDASDWVFPVRDGVEVRAQANAGAPVVEKLGLFLIRVLPDDSPANAVMAAFVKIMTPSGRVGFVATEAVLPIGGEQLCYIKEGNVWRIAGFYGGDPSQ